MIRIDTLNKIQLKEYIDSPGFYNTGFVPISKHRAISHINNPRANEDDIIMILAYDTDKLVGYLGVLPDYIFIGNKQKKIGWLSCIYVDAGQRGKRIAQKLVEKSFEVWNDNILLTEFTEPAKKLYDRIGKFSELSSLHGIRLYLRADLQKILPPKHRFFNKTKIALKIFDSLFNLVFDFRYIFLKNKKHNLKFEYIKKIDDETIDFIRKKQSDELFKRGKKELNWMMSFPWVITTPKPECSKYHFSAIDKSFDFIPVKIRNSQGVLTGFIIFANRNGNLKIPYYYCDNVDDIVIAINYHLVKWKIKTASIYNDKIASKLKNSGSPAIFKKPIERNYLISTKFINSISEESKIQDGDGDAAFT